MGFPFCGSLFLCLTLHCISADDRTSRHIKTECIATMIYQPICMDAYGFTDENRTAVRIYTEQGGMLVAKRCPLHLTRGKPLYCTRCGHFFSLTRFGLREVKPCFKPPKNTKLCHTRYPFLRQFADRTCHLLIAATWVERLDTQSAMRMEVDHLNGDMLDWSADNLQWVTPAENRRRARILRDLRTSGTDPCTLSRPQLLSIFDGETCSFFNKPTC